ncbi:hypothetical protein E2I00_009710, partial [Balaenoptera physalus]
IIQLLDDYPKCFIVGADNVGSKQMQQIRMSLRGKAVVLMGKNTMMRKAIRGHLENNPALEKLLPHIRGNVGFVFTKEDLTEIRDMLLANKVPAAARAGAIAPCEIGYPTVASVPHSIIRGYKRVLALSVETDYTFPLSEKADPSAFVAAATTVAPAAAAAAPAKVEAKEESEESDEDMGFGLFDSSPKSSQLSQLYLALIPKDSPDKEGLQRAYDLVLGNRLVQSVIKGPQRKHKSFRFQVRYHVMHMF